MGMVPMNPTQKSLLEQMRIHDIEILRRKELLDFGAADTRLLMACGEFIGEEVESLVELFYEKQTANDDIALIIGDADTLRRLRAAMVRYVTDLFSGFYDEEYVTNRLRIGLVHKRIGVEPKYYLSAMRLLKALLLDVLERRLKGHAELEATKTALDKLLYFDNELVFETYIRSLVAEVESARNKAVEYAVGLEQKVLERTRELQDLSRRDPLTGLYNHRHLGDVLRAELNRGKRLSLPLVLLYMDLDGFKVINDKAGHLVGDEILRRFSQALQRVARNTDICVRYGGDEFCVLLLDTERAGALEFEQRLLAELEQESDVPRPSIGMAQAGPFEWPSPTALIAQADQRMYAAKAARRAGEPVLAIPE